MESASAEAQDRSAKNELSVFLQRFMHLAEGTAVLAHSDLTEAEEQALRPARDLQAALNMVDLVSERLHAARTRLSELQAQLENEKNANRTRSERDSSLIGEWIGRYKYIFAENMDLRARLAAFEEQYGML